MLKNKQHWFDELLLDLTVKSILVYLNNVNILSYGGDMV